jgi:hypothetical protein
MTSSRLNRFILALVLTLSSVAAQAAPPKAITKVPFVIKKPGTYVLSKNLTYDGEANAIQIEADDVTLDLRGYTLTFGGSDPIAQQSSGIYGLDRTNVTIRNGTVRGFYRGLFLDATSVVINGGGHVVEDLRADRSIHAGIQVEGRSSILRNNWVSLVRRITPGTAICYGFRLSGAALGVISNRVSDVYVTPGGVNSSYGFLIESAESSRVAGNSISNTTTSLNINTVGFGFNNCQYSVVTGNQVNRYGLGMQFNDSDDLLYRDNTVTGSAFSDYNNDGSAEAGTGNL